MDGISKQSVVAECAEGLWHTGLQFGAGLAASGAAHYVVNQVVQNKFLREEARFLGGFRGFLVGSSYSLGEWLVSRYLLKENRSWGDLGLGLAEVALISGLGGQVFSTMPWVRPALAGLAAGACNLARAWMHGEDLGDRSVLLSTALCAGIGAFASSSFTARKLGTYEANRLERRFVQEHCGLKEGEVNLGVFGKFNRKREGDLLVSTPSNNPVGSEGGKIVRFVPSVHNNESCLTTLPKDLVQEGIPVEILQYPYNESFYSRGMLGALYLADRWMAVASGPMKERLTSGVVSGYSLGGMLVHLAHSNLSKELQTQIPLRSICAPFAIPSPLETSTLARRAVDALSFLRFAYPKPRTRKIIEGVQDAGLASLVWRQRWFSVCHDQATGLCARAVRAELKDKAKKAELDLSRVNAVFCGRDGTVPSERASQALRGIFPDVSIEIENNLNHYPFISRGFLSEMVMWVKSNFTA